ncbi:MAG: hypothetical protein GY774_20970 [Planctomycetes bacterium]|nr:hypothetical protein [Planctomycetota bacterium]
MRKIKWFQILIIVSIGFLLACTAFAEDTPERKGKSGYGDAPDIGGPASVGGLLAEDDVVKEPALRFPSLDKALKPWFEWKRGLNEKYGLQIGAAYTALYQSADDVPAGAEDEAALGIFRVFGKWEMLGRGTENTGTLVFSGDNRHRTGGSGFLACGHGYRSRRCRS